MVSFDDIVSTVHMTEGTQSRSNTDDGVTFISIVGESKSFSQG